MNFPKLTFPLTVDFSSTGYWLGDQGPFPYGTAVTAFFIGEDITEAADNGVSLMRELERQLFTFGSHLQPYLKERAVDMSLFLHPERRAVSSSICYALHPAAGSTGVIVERHTFASLRDFLYVELGKSIAHGNAPRQCRLCGQWFLHEQGSRAVYCDRIAPGETKRTCREAGARAVFEKKIQDEDAWKLYKRAYKKYYARYMKGTMSEGAFKAWGAQAAKDRDDTIEQLKSTVDAALNAQLVKELREKLNQK